MGWGFFAYLRLGIFTLMLSGIALAYPTPVDFDGRVMRWPIERESGMVTYEVTADYKSDQDLYEDLVDEAASVWGHAGGSYVTYQKAREDEEAKVTIKLVRILKDGAFASGYTTFDRYDAQGQPSHCSIFIHISESYSYNGIAKTILHELGHGLGLGHTLIPEAIMSYSLTKNQFALDTDDEAAIARLYPADGAKPHLAPGCAVGSGGAPSGSLAMVATQLILLGLPLLAGVFSAFQPIASMRSMDFLARRRMSSGT